MSAATLEKVYEESRLRRGRPSTVASWYVNTPSGTRWRFWRKKDADRFIGAGCVCAKHVDGISPCALCLGRIVPQEAL